MYGFLKKSTLLSLLFLFSWGASPLILHAEEIEIPPMEEPSFNNLDEAGKTNVEKTEEAVSEAQEEYDNVMNNEASTPEQKAQDEESLINAQAEHAQAKAEYSQTVSEDSAKLTTSEGEVTVGNDELDPEVSQDVKEQYEKVNEEKEDLNEAQKELKTAKDNLEEVNKEGSGATEEEKEAAQEEVTEKQAKVKKAASDLNDATADLQETNLKTVEPKASPEPEVQATDAAKGTSETNTEEKSSGSKEETTAEKEQNDNEEETDGNVGTNQEDVDDLDKAIKNKKIADDNLDTANQNVETAQDNLNEAEASGNTEDIKKAKQELQDAKDKQLEAKHASENAEKNVGDVSEKDVDAAVKKREQIREKKAANEEKLNDAKEDLEQKQKDLEQAKADGLDTTEQEQAVKAAQEKVDNLEQTKADLEAQEKILDEHVSKLKRFGKWLKGKWDFIKEQLIMGVMMMVPGDLIDAWKQAMKNKALYKTITEVQTFAGIRMKVLDGLVPEEAPDNGIYVYADVDASGEIQDLNSPQRRFFVSADSFNNYAQDYLGSGKVDSMMELVTGAQIDGAGIVAEVAPFFEKTLVKGSSYSSGPKPLETMLDEQSQFVSGAVHKEVASELMSESPGFMSTHSASAPGNPTMAKLMATNTTLGYSPILQSSLNAFNAGQVLSRFGGIKVKQMQGLGPLTYAIETDSTSSKNRFLTLFCGDGNSDDTKIGASILTELKAGKDLTVTTANPVAALENEESKGLTAEESNRLLGEQIYVYESDNTPMAQFLKSKVKKHARQLAPLVHDYLVAVNDIGDIIPMQVPVVQKSAPVVVWQENPEIAYVVSLISGATFLPVGPGSSMQMLPLENSPDALSEGDGSSTANYKITNQAETNYKAIALVGGKSPTEIGNQVIAMRQLAQTLITEGPFVLPSGVVAKKVDFLAGKNGDILSNATAEDIQKANMISELGKVAQGETLKTTDSVDLTTKEKMLNNGVFVYRIDNALPTKDGTALPDYVVPVTVNEATGNYLMLPLGTQAGVESGATAAKESSEVLALISLVTSKVYDASYNVLPDTFKTNILKSPGPGLLLPCQKGNTAETCDSANYQIQPGGQNVPLSTAFMETDLNPVNTTQNAGNEVEVLPLHFMTMKYDYCDESVTTDASDFINIGKCQKPKTLPVQLYRILPQIFTGIPWPSSVNKEDQTEIAQAESLHTMLTNYSGTVSAKTSTNNSTGSSTNSSTTTDDVTNYSIAYVHNLWKDAILGKDPHKLILAEGPHNFTTNAFDNWQLTAPATAVLNGVYLYRLMSPTKAIPGLWVPVTWGTPSSDFVVPDPTKPSAATMPSGFAYNASSNYGALGNLLGLRNLNPTGTAAFGVVHPTAAPSLDKIGGEFDYGKHNGLINLYNGQALVRTKVTLGTHIYDVIAPLTNMFGQTYRFDVTTTGKTATADTNAFNAYKKSLGSTALLLFSQKSTFVLMADINQAQGDGSSNRVGPISFGLNTLFIDRQQINNGNYIYQSYTGDLDNPTVQDYFVGTVTDSSGNTMWGVPISYSTESIVSLTTGKEFPRDGSNDSYFAQLKWQFKGQYGVLEYDPSATKPTPGALILSGFPAKIGGLLKKRSGVAIDKDLMDAMTTMNTTYVNSLKNPKTDSTTTPDTTQSYEDWVTAHAPAFPGESSLTSIVNQNGALFKDSTGNFYLGNINAVTNNIPVPTVDTSQTSGTSQTNKSTSLPVLNPIAVSSTASTTTGSTDPSTTIYYAFNVDIPTPSGAKQTSSSKNNGTYWRTQNLAKNVSNGPIVKVIPTGVYYSVDSSGNATVSKVMYGGPAMRMAEAHGITIDLQTGAQSNTVPVARQALAMTAKDKNLTGGLDGTIMKRVSDWTKTEGTVTYYLYENMSNFSGQSASATTTGTTTATTTASKTPPSAASPSDILMQVNPSNGTSYYISIMSGLEYTIDGHPLPVQAQVYYPQRGYGPLVLNQPLTVWNDSSGLEMQVPVVVKEATVDAGPVISFVHYRADMLGTTYQYTSTDGKTIYNFTSINPATGQIDGGAYQVNATDPKTVIKSWPAPAQWTSGTTKVSPSVLTQGGTTMGQALKYAKAQNLLPSQRIYSMTEVGGVEGVAAHYDITKKQWALYTINTQGASSSSTDTTVNSTTLPREPMRIFVQATGKNAITPYVLNFIGKATEDATSSSSSTDSSTTGSKLDVAKLEYNSSNVVFNRLIYFTQNKVTGTDATTDPNTLVTNSAAKPVIPSVILPAAAKPGKQQEIGGFTFLGHYFSIDQTGRNRYIGAGYGMSITETDYPSINGVGTSGDQFPTDINYFIVQNQGKITSKNSENASGTKYVYGYSYPALDASDLSQYFDGWYSAAATAKTFAIQPVTSNQGVSTVIRNVNTATLTQVTTNNVHSGTEPYSSYKTTIQNNVTDYYAKALTRALNGIDAQAAQAAAQYSANPPATQTTSATSTTTPSSTSSSTGSGTGTTSATGPVVANPSANIASGQIKPWCFTALKDSTTGLGVNPPKSCPPNSQDGCVAIAKDPSNPTAPANPTQPCPLSAPDWWVKLNTQVITNDQTAKKATITKYNKFESNLALQKVNALFATIEANIGKLYIDGTTGELLYKVSSADSGLIAYGAGFIKDGWYVSYPNAVDPGGFVFDSTGTIQPDVVLSGRDMTTIMNEMGGLRVESGQTELHLVFPEIPIPKFTRDELMNCAKNPASCAPPAPSSSSSTSSSSSSSSASAETQSTGTASST